MEIKRLENKLQEELKKFKVIFKENVRLPPFAPTAFYCDYELIRVLTECLEVVFTYHNIKKRKLDIISMIGLMDQIIPTACVLGTSFWVFYVNDMTRICTCWEYDMQCLHCIDDAAKVWLSAPPVRSFLENYPVVPNGTGVVFPKDVTFILAACGTHLDILQEFIVCNKTTMTSTSNCTQVAMLSRLRFVQKRNHISDNRVLLLDPSPVLHPYYGWALQDVLLKMYPRYYKQMVVCLSQTPAVTLSRDYTYIQMIPSIKYNVEMPIMFSSNNYPLTRADFRVVRDICNSLLFRCGGSSERVSAFISIAQRECVSLGCSMYD